MIRFKLIPIDQQENWGKVLQQCGRYDIYHGPQYHRVSQLMGEGAPYIFTYQNQNRWAALPFLLRPVSEVKGLESFSANDATSVYGYSGVLSNVQPNDENAVAFRSGFQEALHQALKQKNIVSLFTRLNPLIDTQWLLDGLIDVAPLGPTVAINLTQSLEDQEKAMNQRVRRDLRKAIKAGVTIEEDTSFARIDEFIAIYNETMRARNAQEFYFFPKQYYLHLKTMLGDDARLYFAELNGDVISTALFFTSGDIIQYHLSGTPSHQRKYSGLKLIFDAVRRWGTENGYACFHLGGGVGAARDSLLDFKAGFSKTRYDFGIAKMILDPQLYSVLNRARQLYENRTGCVVLSENFFPRYRRPVKIQQETVTA